MYTRRLFEMRVKLPVEMLMILSNLGQSTSYRLPSISQASASSLT